MAKIDMDFSSGGGGIQKKTGTFSIGLVEGTTVHVSVGFEIKYIFLHTYVTTDNSSLTVDYDFENQKCYLNFRNTDILTDYPSFLPKIVLDADKKGFTYTQTGTWGNAVGYFALG